MKMKTIYQNLRKTANAILPSIEQNFCQKEERSQINKQNFHSKKLERERVGINKIEKRNIIREKSGKLKTNFKKNNNDKQKQN